MGHSATRWLIGLIVLCCSIVSGETVTSAATATLIEERGHIDQGQRIDDGDVIGEIEGQANHNHNEVVTNRTFETYVSEIPMYSRFGNAVSMPAEYEYDDTYEIVIPLRDEEEYIERTLLYIYSTADLTKLGGIILVDDASKRPVSELLQENATKHKSPSQAQNPTFGQPGIDDWSPPLPKELLSLIKVIRFDQPEGLIRARIAGADLVDASNIFFLDGHCRLDRGWESPLLKLIEEDYRTIATPTIYDIERVDFSDIGTEGTKMMFDWDFEFDWFNDFSSEVPISSGGILMISKRWWEESGKYDSGMKEWGAENIEQSLRTWLCGGRVMVTNESRIGHIFSRDPKPNPGGELVRQVIRNQMRTALVWLDDYYSFFEEKRFDTLSKLEPGSGIEYRMMIKEHLNCRNFEWFVKKFRSAFERSGLLYHHFHHLQRISDKSCVGDTTTNGLVFGPCVPDSKSQRWQSVFGNRMIYNQHTKKCLTIDNLNQDQSANGFSVTTKDCDWEATLLGANSAQFFMTQTQSDPGFLYTDTVTNYESVDGNDILEVAYEDPFDVSETVCLNESLKMEACKKSGTSRSTWKWLW